MPPTSRIFALLVVSASLLAVWLWTRFDGVSASEDVRGIRVETVRVLIDDAFVAQATSTHSLIEPLWFQVDIYGSWDRYEETLRPFSRSQRQLLAIQWYRCEVNNGGHAQFFGNSTGIVWEDASEGLKAIGLHDGAAILESASERLGGASRDRSTREAQLGATKADFSDLDERFFSLEQTGAFDDKMLAFARAHASDFHFEGSVERTTLPGIENVLPSK